MRPACATCAPRYFPLKEMKRALPDHQAYFEPTSVLRDFMQLTRISSLIEDNVVLELIPNKWCV